MAAVLPDLLGVQDARPIPRDPDSGYNEGYDYFGAWSPSTVYAPYR
jgi:hypothetical protein